MTPERAMHVIPIIEEDEGRPSHLPVLPLRTVQIHIIIDKNPQTLSPPRLRVEQSLIPGIAIIDDLHPREEGLPRVHP